ncbi:CoB--CoM heterodisulfide reductase iron-sulfur subunit B family protein [Desulfovibrio sp. OttesenSCG-928-F07]|nr:CoB--CoM heterodisulfide reductase iron-sulfur subunit B family protein [Desulfovibrio sp. OttesenSCG-928-F07]
MKSYAYYPGCSGAGTSIEYDASTRAVCEALDIKLVDIPDWNCCGSTPAHTVDHTLSAALSARNLAQSESLGLDHILTPCPSCLKNTHNAIEHLKDEHFKQMVNALTQRPLTREHSVSSVLQIILEEITPAEITARVKKPLTGLKVVPYYGCLMTRPGRSMHFDDEENPTSLDLIMEAAGATVLPFAFKVECCGGAFGIPRNDVVAKLGGRIMEMAKLAGADAVVAACPLCQMNLDMRQGQIRSKNNLDVNMPVFYYTQLLGLALGVDEKKLRFEKLITNPKAVLGNIGKNSGAAKPEQTGTGAEAAAPAKEEAKA